MRRLATNAGLILAAAWIVGCTAPPAPAPVRPGVTPYEAEQVRVWGLAHGWTEVQPKPSTQPQDEESAETALPSVERGEAGGRIHKPTAGELFVGFVPNSNDLVLRDQPPSEAATKRPLHTMTFPGEFESLCIAIHAYGDFAKLELSVSDLESDAGGLIPAADIQVRELVYAPLSLRNTRQKENRFQMWPMWLVTPKPAPLKAGQGRVFWLTVRVPANAKPGRYTGTVKALAEKSPAEAHAITREIALDVQPFKLDGSLCSWAPVTAGNGFDLAVYQQMAEHHMTGLSWWWGDWGLTVTRQGEGATVRAGFDPAPMDELNAVTQAAGLRGPWIIFLGNMIRGHLECRIAGYYRDGRRQPLFDGAKLVPIPKSKKSGVQPERIPSVADMNDCAEMDRRYVEVLGALAARAKEKGYPQIILCPYDEPTKYLFKHNAHWAELIMKHTPQFKVLNTPQGSVEWARNLMPYSDLMDVQGGGDRIYDATIKAGKGIIGYSRLTANQTFAQARYDMGLRFARQQPNVIYFWSLNFGTVDPRTPFNDLNDHDSGARHRFAWPDKSGYRWVETIVWEAQREGAKDYLLLLMLERELKRSKSPTAERIRGELEAFKADSEAHATNQDGRRAKLVKWYLELKAGN